MTLLVDEIKNVTSAVSNLTLDTSGNVTAGANLTVTGSATLPTIAGNPTLSGNPSFTGNPTFSNVPSFPSSLAMRNRIINGDMRIDQRNAGASVTPTANGTYCLDRYRLVLSQASKFAIQRVSTAGTPVGFTNAMLITSLSAYSILSTDSFVIQQRIEGFNVSDLFWGTASAKAVTLNFWAYSSQGGTFGGSFRNDAANRSYPFTYSLTANTWTNVSISIAGDTTGTWETGSSTGIEINFGLGVGSTLSGTAGAWVGANYLSATSAVSVVGTNAATFYITGVQLEVGTVATPFERQIYSNQLAQCQRYYQQSRACATDNGAAAATKVYNVPVNFNVAMRAAPTITYTAITSTNVTSRAAVNIFEFGFNHQVTASAGPGMAEVSTALSTAEL